MAERSVRPYTRAATRPTRATLTRAACSTAASIHVTSRFRRPVAHAAAGASRPVLWPAAGPPFRARHACFVTFHGSSPLIDPCRHPRTVGRAVRLHADGTGSDHRRRPHGLRHHHPALEPHRRPHRLRPADVRGLRHAPDIGGPHAGHGRGLRGGRQAARLPVPRLTDRRPATNRHLAVDDDRLRGSHPLGVPIRIVSPRGPLERKVRPELRTPSPRGK